MAPSSKKTTPVDLSKVRQIAYADRSNKAQAGSFGRPMETVAGSDFFESLPDFLKAADLKRFISSVAAARRDNRPFHLLMGAHAIKVGLSPILIDLMEREIVTGWSLNSAGLIHDLEVAFFGGTSEDVQSGLADGSFGMVKETAELFAAVVDLAAKEDCGLGEAAGRFIDGEQARNSELSLFAAASRLECPTTIHVAIGTDIVAQHPCYDGGKVGAASFLDFRILCSICAEIDRGGTVANIGSAVILPEVFLKALTVARNLNPGRSQLTTANFDMIAQYRPAVNVVSRPTHGAGQGYNFAGHHEVMIPLLAWGLRRALGR
ncbi:MAG: hypothetical protein ABIE70_00920 [bacterium]